MVLAEHAPPAPEGVVVELACRAVVTQRAQVGGEAVRGGQGADVVWRHACGGNWRDRSKGSGSGLPSDCPGFWAPIIGVH
jgi:hypothetical protein